MTLALRVRCLRAPACLALIALAAACGGGDQPNGGIVDPADLAGRTVGIVSQNSIATLELRYVLQEGYGLELGAGEPGSVTLEESPSESLEELLLDGDLAAALPSQRGAYRLRDIDDLRVLINVTDEMRDLAGTTVAHSVLLTYPDVAEQKNESLVELSRMLTESMTYFRANQDPVISAVAEKQNVDPDFLRWWWDRYELTLGELEESARDQIVNVWEVAATLGDIAEAPELDALLFAPLDVEPEADGDRTTVSLAVLDGPGRRGALYAIEQGLVTSDTIDLDVTYLGQTPLTEAAAAKQFDAIEGSPLAVPLGMETDLDFLILSAALQNLDGTLLFVRDGGG